MWKSAANMIEIEYSIGEIKTLMLVNPEHTFFLSTQSWIKAKELKAGITILAKNGDTAEVTNINVIEGQYQCRNLMVSHNHHYFISAQSQSLGAVYTDTLPSNELERVAYLLADKPSHFADGKPTGDHSGPWAAACYFDHAVGQKIIAWGRANDLMCAEDAAVSNLRLKLGDSTSLHQGNVNISHAYIRKYTKKGRFVNTMSPCQHCRDNYGDALNDSSLGTSDIIKSHRDSLPSLPD